LDQQPRALPELKLGHLSRMTDSTGLFQHAIFTVPNFSKGYCTDDNARAFILALLLDEMEEEPESVRTLATNYAAFLHHAFDPKTKRFHNHLSFDRRWLDEQGSEDSHGRALWALGMGVGRSPYRSFQVMSGQIFTQALAAASGDFRPIGNNGFYPRGGTRANFDQQPVEAQAMVSACLEAYRATSDAWWYEHAQRAFDWFLGWNDLGLELYSATTGGCRDA